MVHWSNLVTTHVYSFRRTAIPSERDYPVLSVLNYERKSGRRYCHWHPCTFEAADEPILLLSTYVKLRKKNKNTTGTPQEFLPLGVSMSAHGLMSLRRALYAVRLVMLKIQKWCHPPTPTLNDSVDMIAGRAHIVKFLRKMSEVRQGRVSNSKPV